jgi:hypothetical protein
VVFLRDTVPVTEDVNGTKLEVWLKLPGSTNFAAKRRTVSGSGLCVISSNVAYLVTAKHVAIEMTEECEVLMRGDSNTPFMLRLSTITGQPNVRWIHHPDADVSIHPLPTVTKEGAEALLGRSIPLDALEAKTNLPARDVCLTTLGFPLGLGTDGEFIPLSRESKVSSGMLRGGNTLFFLLQDPSVSGYSGGPLIDPGDARLVPIPQGIEAVSYRPRCWGFVSATFGDETGGKMCRITPAFYAVQLIHKAEKEEHIISAIAPWLGKK